MVVGAIRQHARAIEEVRAGSAEAVIGTGWLILLTREGCSRQRVAPGYSVVRAERPRLIFVCSY